MTVNLNEWKYERTDKNGTKHYYSNLCPKCGGKGNIPYYAYIDNGVCFNCGGSGTVDYVRHLAVRTPEYEAKLEERRKERLKKGANARKEKFFEENSFNKEGYVYVYIGDTYSIKDVLRSKGAYYNRSLGWHSEEEIEGYPSIKVSYKEICNLDDYEVPVSIDYIWVKDLVEKANLALRTKESKSQYIGEVGTKTVLEGALDKVSSFETKYSYYGELNYIYIFSDKDGNVFTWKTAKNLDITEGDSVFLKGTVKAHTEYKGVKQTVLTRCSLLEK